ncbi:MAG: transposase family protein [Sphingobacteriales bacterium]
MNKKPGISTYFSTMKDYRLDRKQKHDILDIIAITNAAVVCGAEDWYEIEELAIVNESWFKTFFMLENGIPVVCDYTNKTNNPPQ